MKKILNKLILISISGFIVIGLLLKVDGVIYADDLPFIYSFHEKANDDKSAVTLSLDIDKRENIEIKEIHFGTDVLEITDKSLQVSVEKEIHENNTYEFEVYYTEKVEVLKELEKEALIQANNSSEGSGQIKTQVLTYKVSDIVTLPEVSSEDSLKTPSEETSKTESTLINNEIPAQFSAIDNLAATNKLNTRSAVKSGATDIKFFIFGNSSDKGMITGYMTSAQDTDGSGSLVNPPRDVVIPESYQDGLGNTIAITKIGLNAFAGMSTYIDSITLNENLESIGEKAFYNLTSLKSIIIPAKVKTIGTAAFFGCSGLTSITIPESVTSIGDSTFNSCSGLTSITIPESVTSIGGYAFYGCSGLTSITIPESVTSIGDSTFYSCSGLTSITIPEKVTSIGSSAFDSCSGLTSITIPEKVTSIGSSAFRYCSSLTSITIPESVTSISGSTFGYCSNLTSITIPKSVTSIGGYAFDSCGNLTSIIIPEKVTSIGSSAFQSCSRLTSIMIPEGVTSISASTFGYCSNLTSITIPKSVISIGTGAFYNCSKLTSITIPESVTSIGTNAFYNCEGLTSITIPESVTSIGTNAFAKTSIIEIKVDKNFNEITGKSWGASGAKIQWKNTDSYVGCFYYSDGVILGTKYEGHKDCNSPKTHTNGIYDIPASIDGKKITEIGDYAFQDEVTLLSVNLPSGITKIGDSAFYNCVYLNSLIIPEGVTSIGASAFRNCKGLTGITLSNNLTSIGDSVFYDCSSLTSITIPESVTSIGSSAFNRCSSLTSITIPESVTSIGSSAFNRCSSLTSITIPESVTSIGSSAFYNCSKLTSITIPESVTSIGDTAFYGCSSLTSITIPESVTSIDDYTFFDCSSLTSITLPNNLTRIAQNTFFDCSSLTSITIPESVTSIGSTAFYRCSSLKSITIPKSVTYIGSSAFQDCSNLSQVKWNDKIMTIGSSAFQGTKLSTINKLPDSVTTIGSNAFDSSMSMILINRPRSTAPVSLTSTQPWGATSAKIYYAGEFIDFTYTVEKKGYERVIHYTFSAGGSSGTVQSILLPNGTTLPAISASSYAGEYTVKENKIYNFEVLSASNEKFPYQVTIDDIGKINLEANDFVIDKGILNGITDLKSLLDTGFVKATDVDLNKEINITTDKTLDEIKKTLVNNGDSVKLTLSVANGFGTTATKTIQISLINDEHSIKYMDGMTELSEVLVKDKNKATNWIPVKTGATFEGWYNEKTLNTVFDFNTLITDDTILYAKWKESLYTVKYESGFTDLSITDKTNVKWNDADLLPNNVSEKGYTLIGWKVGTTSVTSTTAFKDISASDVDGTSITLTAQWSKNKYTINFESGQPGVNIPNQSDITIDDVNFLPGNPTKQGYSFVGWKMNGKPVDKSKPFGDLITNEKDGDTVTLVGQWKESLYTVKYESGFTDLSITDKTNVKWNDADLLPNNVSEKGYTLIGWKVGTTSVTSTTAFKDISASDVDGTSITLTAQWKKSEYTVKYESGFTDLSITDKTNVKWNDADLLPNNVSEKGYTLIGWKVGTTSVTSTTAFKDISTSDVDGTSITLTAQWNKNKYTINFESGQPGVNIPNRPDVTIDDNDFLAENPTKPGYDFDGWEMNGKPVDKDKPFGDIVTDEKDGEIITIIGKWSKKKYNIKFSYVGDIPEGFESKDIIVEFENKIIEPLINQPKGYEFIGWYRDLECTQSYDFNLGVSEHINLYGKWLKTPSPDENQPGQGGGSTDTGKPNQPNQPSQGGNSTDTGNSNNNNNSSNIEQPDITDTDSTTNSKKEIVTEVIGRISKDDILSGITTENLKKYIKTYTEDGEEDYTVLSAVMNDDTHQYEVTVRLSNGEIRNINIEIMDNQLYLGHCLYDWMIAVMMVCYAIYGSLSIYRAYKIRKLKKSGSAMRAIITVITLIGISVAYVLCTCGLAIWCYIPSVFILILFMGWYYLQKKRLNRIL